MKTRYLTVTLALASIFALNLVGCSSGGNNGAGATNPATAPNDGSSDNSSQVTASSIQGTWDLCSGIRTTYVFSGNTWEQYIAYFDTPDCSGAPQMLENLQPADEPFVTGTFELRGEVTTEGGVLAHELNMTANTFDTVTQYTIVYLGTPGELVFGTSAGFSAEERPTALDFEDPYIRRQ